MGQTKKKSLITDMTKGTPWKLILAFSLPLLVGNIVQQLYSMVDALIVGQYVGVDALAAVGSTGSANFLVLGFAMGMTSGFSVLIAQRFGAGEETGLKRAVASSIVLSILVTVILTIISVVFVRDLLELMQTPANIIDEAEIYIGIIFWGIGASIYYNLIAGILRALGDSKTPLYFLIVSSVINVILDILFISVFSMGVAGAGVATVISQLISAVLCTIYAIKSYPILRLTKEDFRWEKRTAVGHLKIGLPMALQFSVTAVGCMILQWALNGFGSTVIAAYTAANKVEGIIHQPFGAIGVAMATFCGQNLGARRIDRIKKGVWVAVLFGAVTSMIASLINWFLGENITKLFLDSPNSEVLYYSTRYLNIIAFFYPALGLLYIFRNVLQGMGESLVPMLGGVAELIARFLVGLYLAPKYGYDGVCYGSPLAWVVAGLMVAVAYYYSLYWNKKGYYV